MKVIISEEQYKSLLEYSNNKLIANFNKTGFWGEKGAGCIILSKNTGRVLIPLRSEHVAQKGTWGTWGGAIDENESPIDAVKREVSEEAGYTGDMKIIPLHVFKHNSGFKYYNYLVVVNDEFKPKLNWETKRAHWFYPDELPNPLHFGLDEILSNQTDVNILNSFLDDDINENKNKQITVEAKDYVYGNYKGKIIEASNEDYDAVPFIYFNNKVYVGYNPELGYNYMEDGYEDENGETNYPNFHSDIPGFYEFIYDKPTNLPLKRKDYEYLGRFWFDRNVISFWKYPESPMILKRILSLINDEMIKIYDYSVDFDNYIIDINDNEGNTNNLISVNDYIKGLNATDDELEAIHNLPASEKQKTSQMQNAMFDKYQHIANKLGSMPQAKYNYYKNYAMGDSKNKTIGEKQIIISEEQFNQLSEYMSNDMVSLNRYLSQSEEEKKAYLPQQFPYFFDEFMSNEDPYMDFVKPRNYKYVDVDGNTIDDGEMEGYDLIEWIDKNNHELYDKYADWLYAQIQYNELDVPYSEYPAWAYFDKPSIVKNQWLIHFTNEPDDIALNGFKYGVDDMEKLGLTTHLGEFDKKYGGYNFAYLLKDFNSYGRAGHGSRGGEYKYGKEAVIFRASGIKVYHYGDEEPQVIFYGNTATNIIPVKVGENANWAVYNNKTGRVIVESDDLEKIAYWIEKNYPQYHKTL